MKKVISAFLCLLIAVIFMANSTAAENHLFGFDPNCVERIEVSTGWGNQNTLDASQNEKEIHEIIRILNDFAYDETIDLSDYYGWYVSLVIVDEDGTEQGIEIGVDGAFDPNSSKRIQCISTQPGIFGESWLELLFPYSFTDLKMWQEISIKFAYDSGLMQGTSETTFSPDAVITRGMFITVLGRMAKIDEKDYPENMFEDVRDTDYYAAYASWAQKSGIMRGTADKTFSPNEPVTREQAVIILARYAEALHLNYPTTTNPFKPRFTDTGDTSKEFQEKLPVLHAASIFPPLDDNELFDPAGTMTREDAAGIFETVYRVLYEW